MLTYEMLLYTILKPAVFYAYAFFVFFLTKLEWQALLKIQEYPCKQLQSLGPLYRCLGFAWVYNALERHLEVCICTSSSLEQFLQTSNISYLYVACLQERLSDPLMELCMERALLFIMMRSLTELCFLIFQSKIPYLVFPSIGFNWHTTYRIWGLILIYLLSCVWLSPLVPKKS